MIKNFLITKKNKNSILELSINNFEDVINTIKNEPIFITLHFLKQYCEAYFQTFENNKNLQESFITTFLKTYFSNKNNAIFIEVISEHIFDTVRLKQYVDFFLSLLDENLKQRVILCLPGTWEAFVILNEYEKNNIQCCVTNVFSSEQIIAAGFFEISYIMIPFQDKSKWYQKSEEVDTIDLENNFVKECIDYKNKNITKYKICLSGIDNIEKVDELLTDHNVYILSNKIMPLVKLSKEEKIFKKSVGITASSFKFGIVQNTLCVKLISNSIRSMYTNYIKIGNLLCKANNFI